jgi:hypothetical protein
MDWKPYAKQIQTEYQGIAPFYTSFAACNAYEIMAKQRGININLSDRHLAVLSKSALAGQTFPNVLNAFINYGVVSEQDCPFPWWMRWFFTNKWVWSQISNISNLNPAAKHYKIDDWYSIDINNASIQKGLEDSPTLLLINSPYTPSLQGYHAVVGLNINNYSVETYDSVLQVFGYTHIAAIQEAYCISI